MISEYIENLTRAFDNQRNDSIAQQQKSYLKGQFEFFGLKTPLRREIQKPFFRPEYLPTKSEAIQITKILWEKPEREFHYFGQELMMQFKNKLDEEDLEFIEYMITHNSWWDTVDMIASHIAGAYFKKYPGKKRELMLRWSISDHMWIRRTSIIFQLKYKDETDKELLAQVIENNLGSKEFFINKAIGWALRTYSAIDPEWVKEFVENHQNLSHLSKKEALRSIS
ncbi:MAG: DNA alkylation repair protein [Crocinitomicaceae bacterium]